MIRTINFFVLLSFYMPLLIPADTPAKRVLKANIFVQPNRTLSLNNETHTFWSTLTIRCLLTWATGTQLTCEETRDVVDNRERYLNMIKEKSRLPLATDDILVGVRIEKTDASAETDSPLPLPIYLPLHWLEDKKDNDTIVFTREGGPNMVELTCRPSQDLSSERGKIKTIPFKKAVAKALESLN